MKVRVDFDHIDETQEKADRLIRQGLADGASEVAEEAQRIVPVDWGILRGGIQVVPGPTRASHIVFYVINDVMYADFVEFGVGIYREEDAPGAPGRRSAWVYYSDRYGFVTTEGNRPQPFMRPSFDRYARRVPVRIAALLKAEL